MASNFQRSTDLSREINAVNKRLRTFLDDLVGQKAISTRRMVPFLVLLQGVAGGGKTNIAEAISHAIANKNGYDHSGIYDWQDAVNFQDGLNHTHWCVRMDDVDQGVAPDQAGVRNHVQNVIAMVNNNPFPVEAAQVDLKGKIRAAPHLVTYTTNFFGCNLEGHTLQPLAFWRRVGIKIEVSAASAFSKGKGVLDRELAAAAETHDIYSLYVSFFDPVNASLTDKWKIPFSTPVEMTFSDVMALIQTLYVKHLAFERSRIHDPTTGEFCDTCGLNVTRKSCSHTKQGPLTDFISFAYTRGFLDAVMPKGSVFQIGVLALMYGTTRLLEPRVTRVFNSVKDYAMTHAERINRMVSAGYVPEVLAQFATGALALTLVTAALSYTFTYSMQGREANMTQGLVPKDWVRADQTFTPGLPSSAAGSTFTKGDLDQALVQSHLFVYNDENVLMGHAFIVAQNLLLVPTHLVQMGGVSSFKTAERTLTFQVTGLNSKIFPSNKELLLIRHGDLKGLPSIGAKMWAVDDSSIQSFDEIEIWSNVLMHRSTSNARINLPMGVVWGTRARTEHGDCGSFHIARFGKSWRIIGMHYEFLEFSETDYKAVAGIVTRSELEKVAHSLTAVLQGVETSRKMLSKVSSEI